MNKYKITVLIESFLILVLAAVLTVTFFSKESSETSKEPEEKIAEAVETSMGILPMLVFSALICL